MIVLQRCFKHYVNQKPKFWGVIIRTFLRKIDNKGDGIRDISSKYYVVRTQWKMPNLQGFQATF